MLSGVKAASLQAGNFINKDFFNHFGLIIKRVSVPLCNDSFFNFLEFAELSFLFENHIVIVKPWLVKGK